MKNIDINIDIDMAILEFIDIAIDKGILQNIDIDKISYRLGFGISNTPKPDSRLVHAAYPPPFWDQHPNFDRFKTYLSTYVAPKLSSK